MKPTKVLKLIAVLSFFLVMTSTSALSQQRSQTLYFKNGKQINCDQVWQEGDNLFVVPHGKRFAISYEKKEIDIQRSSVQIPEKTAPPTATRPTTDVVVVPEKGEKSILRIIHHEYSLVPKSPPPKSHGSSSEKPTNPNASANAGNANQRGDVGGYILPNKPITNYGAGYNQGQSGMVGKKRLPDQQNQREANQRNEQEYQQKLREYENQKRQTEEYNKQVKVRITNK